MKLTTINAHDRAVCDAVWQGLLAYNTQFAQRDHQDFTVSIRQGRRIIGGAIGETKFGWTIVQYLWVSEDFRGQDLGTRLMAAVESLARKRSSRGIWLDTFSFQAPRFYAKLGYRKIGRLKDHPVGYSKYWFAKELEK